MLFYTTLFITGFVVVLVLLWLYRTMAKHAQRLYESRIPDAKQGPTAHLGKQKYGKNSRLASKAWGRNPHATPANLARTHPAIAEKKAPWGWKGNDHDIRKHHPKVTASNETTLNSYRAHKNPEDKRFESWKRTVGHPITANRSGLSGQAYRPSQDAVSTFAIGKKRKTKTESR